MKKIITIILSLFYLINIQHLTAQEVISMQNNNPFKASVITGVNFGQLFSGSYFQSFLSPALTFPVNKKFSITTGINYSNTQINNLLLPNFTGNTTSYSGNISTITFNASGLYRINEKVHITGSAFKSINPSFNNRLNPQALQTEAQGVSFGVGYQLNEKTFIGAEIRMQQGYPLYNNPIGPFDHNPFNRNYFSPFR